MNVHTTRRQNWVLLLGVTNIGERCLRLKAVELGRLDQRVGDCRRCRSPRTGMLEVATMRRLWDTGLKWIGCVIAMPLLVLAIVIVAVAIVDPTVNGGTSA